MRKAIFLRYLSAILPMTIWMIGSVSAQTPLGPGTLPAAAAEASGQKAGSVLVFSSYTSSVTNNAAQNSRISITNTSTNRAAFIQLNFVDAATGLVNGSYLCLTPTQTTTFFSSDLDPGVTGYLIAIAVDGNSGCPISHNFLTGSAAVKFASGHFALYGAEAFSALFTQILPGCEVNAITARIAFDGVSYNLAPRALSLDRIRSNADGNSTMLVVSRLDGDTLNGFSALGGLTGIIFNDAPTPFPFTAQSASCQFRVTLSDNSQTTSTPFTSIIKAGTSGWLKVFATADVAVAGIAIQFNQNAPATRTAFNGGQRLDTLSVTNTGGIIMRIFPPSC